MENEVINLCKTCKSCEIFIMSAAPHSEATYDYKCNTPIGKHLTVKATEIKDGQIIECTRYTHDNIKRAEENQPDGLSKDAQIAHLEQRVKVQDELIDSMNLDLTEIGQLFNPKIDGVNHTLCAVQVKGLIESDKVTLKEYRELMQQIIDNKFYLNNSLLHNTAKQFLDK